MSDDWDTVTRIGSKARGPGAGGVDRERVVKGNSQINAAKRAGAIVGSEKKFASANSKSSVDGQRVAALDRETDVVGGPPTVGRNVGQAIMDARKAMNLTQKQLATRANIGANFIQSYENGTGVKNVNHLQALEKILKVTLLSSNQDNIGKPKEFGPKKK